MSDESDDCEFDFTQSKDKGLYQNEVRYRTSFLDRKAEDYI